MPAAAISAAISWICWNAQAAGVSSTRNGSSTANTTRLPMYVIADVSRR